MSENRDFKETGYKHIVLDKNGTPLIAGTTMKVIELVAEKLAYGWSPEELHFQHPYLNLAQIYSALAYYAEHSDELEEELRRRLEEVEALRSANGSSPLRQRLRAKGLL